MAERIYKVEVVTTRIVKVRVPDDVLSGSNNDPVEAAEEFAIGGKAAWPKYVLSEHSDYEVESVSELKEQAGA